jgi:hypothetical protein
MKGTEGDLAYFAHRGETVTLFPFGQATRIGLRSIQPPAAQPAHPTLMGATMERSKSKGAAEASGMASLYVTLLVRSVHDSNFWHWAAVAAKSKPLAILNGFIVLTDWEFDDFNDAGIFMKLHRLALQLAHL